MSSRKPRRPPDEAAAEKVQKRKAPVTFTPELGREICERIALGANIPRLCEEPGMPSRRNILRWEDTHEDFRKSMALAKERRADARSDAIDGYVEQVRIGKLDANSARVMIDAEKWQAARENPRRYGDKISTELSGKDGRPLGEELALGSDTVLIKTARWAADLLLRANDVPQALLKNGSDPEAMEPPT